MRLTEQEFCDLCESKNLKFVRQTKSIGNEPENNTIKGKKKLKYRNRKIYVYNNNIAVYEKNEKLGPLQMTFDSEKEYKRYYELQLLQKAGKISDLKRQTPLEIQEKCVRNGEEIKQIRYVADFTYTKDNITIVEDVKGQDAKTGKYITTKDFDLKWKLLKYKYPDLIFLIY